MFTRKNDNQIMNIVALVSYKDHCYWERFGSLKEALEYQEIQKSDPDVYAVYVVHATTVKECIKTERADVLSFLNNNNN